MVVCVLSHSVMSNSFRTMWTVSRQDPLSMGFIRLEYWSGLPFPTPDNLPDPGFEPASLVPPALEGVFFTNALPEKPIYGSINSLKGEMT